MTEFGYEHEEEEEVVSHPDTLPVELDAYKGALQYIIKNWPDSFAARHAAAVLREW